MVYEEDLERVGAVERRGELRIDRCYACGANMHISLKFIDRLEIKCLKCHHVIRKFVEGLSPLEERGIEQDGPL